MNLARQQIKPYVQKIGEKSMVVVYICYPQHLLQ